MNAKFLVFVICIGAIIHLLLHILHDCTYKLMTFNGNKTYIDNDSLTLFDRR